MKRPLFILLWTMLSACVTGENDPKNTALVETRLTEVPDFPNGKYVHAVDIEVPGRGSWQLRGVLQLESDSIHLTGLSPMGTTVFKIDDEYAKNSPEIVVFQPELQTYEQKILEFYQQLRGQLAGRNLKQPTEVPADWDVNFYPSSKSPPLPPTMAIKAPHFSLRVEVEQYEP